MARKATWTRGLAAVAVLGLLTGCGSTGSDEPAANGDPVDVGVEVPSTLQDRGSLIVGVKCDYPPFGYVEADGSNAGYEISLAHGLAEYAFGNPDAVEFECVSAANRVSMLQNGRVDMLIATLGKTAEREEVMAFSENPYFLSGHSMLAAGDTSIDGWDSLSGQTVISLTGSTGSQLLNQCFPDVNIQEYESASDSLTALSQGRGEVFVYDTAFFAGLVPTSDKYSLVSEPIAPTAAGIGMNKSDAEMQDWVNAALKDMTENDLMWEFFTEWVTDETVLESFADYIPRPDVAIEYPELAPGETCE